MRLASLRSLVLGIAPFLAASAAHAFPAQRPETIAERLARLDRFERTEDAAGLDAPRRDQTNWSDFDILFAAVLADGTLVDAVTDPATAVTLLAPNDRAFQLLAYDLTGELFATEAEVLDAIVQAVQAGAVDLTNVLTYHVVPGKVMRRELPLGQAVPTLNADTLLFQDRLAKRVVEVVDAVESFENAFLLRTDLDAGESVVHAISRVLIPSNVGG